MHDAVCAMVPGLIDTTLGIVAGRTVKKDAAEAAKIKLKQQATDAMAVDSGNRSTTGPGSDISELRKILREELQKELNVRTLFLSWSKYDLTLEDRFPEIFQNGQESARKQRSGNQTGKGKRGPKGGPGPSKGKGKSRAN